MKPIRKDHATQIFAALKLYRERGEWDGFDAKQARVCLEQAEYRWDRAVAWLVRLAIRRGRFTKPDGTPRYIHCYDNGGLDAKSGKGSGDRFTIVFTGRYREKTMGEFWYLSANSNPYHPQGIGLSGSSPTQIDYPTYGHLGKKVKFAELPEEVRRFVLDTYNYLWDLDPCLKCGKIHEYHDPRCPVPAAAEERTSP